MRPPKLTFLLAVRNGAATLAEAVASLLTQTFQDFEILIVDDASSDATPDILRSFHDPRVSILRLDQNAGLSGALNHGLPRARGEFLARMDADDIAFPHRAAAQLDYLKHTPEVAVVGSFIETFSNVGQGSGIRYPAAPGACTSAMLFRSSLAHPAVMWRRAALDKLRYETDFRYAQDYALWFDCVKNGLCLANVPEILLKYRLHDGQLSAAMDQMQDEGTAIRWRFLCWFAGGVSDAELALHEGLSRDRMTADPRWISAAVHWLEKLAAINEQRRIFNHEPLLCTLTGRYVALLRFARAAGLSPVESNLFAPFVQCGPL